MSHTCVQEHPWDAFVERILVLVHSSAVVDGELGCWCRTLSRVELCISASAHNRSLATHSQRHLCPQWLADSHFLSASVVHILNSLFFTFSFDFSLCFKGVLDYIVTILLYVLYICYCIICDITPIMLFTLLCSLCTQYCSVLLCLLW